MTLEEMKRLKQEKGYTMTQLSQYSGVPLGTLQKIFTGETAHPRYATRQAIEKVLSPGQSPENTTLLTENIHLPVTYCYDRDSQETERDCVREKAFVYNADYEKQQGKYTVEDYYAWPKDQRVELIDGRIYVLEAPGFVHQRIAGKILSRLDAYIEQNGGDCIPLLSPINVRLDCDDRTMVQPDLIILCDKSKIKRWGVMGAPDFVLEILSQTTRRKDCTKKLQKYSDAGVREYWILDPEKKRLLTYDFIHDNLPGIYPLTGTAQLAIFDGRLNIDLDEIAGFIQDWPE
ncbi:MAG: DNA-binding protein [Lachnospiraceae bacterium]|nr:DNA-binding protein [Lachnospiraceae bacterium]